MHITPSQNKAAGQLIELIVDRIASGRAVHSSTAIASVARLAGSLLMRSFKPNLPSVEPGAVVLSVEANEQGPELIGIMSAMLQHYGVSLDNSKLRGDQVSRGEEPELSVLQSLALLQEGAIGIAQKNDLGLKEVAHAAAIATAFVVKECAKDIGGEVGFNIAVYGFIEGSKTAPPAVGPEL